MLKSITLHGFLSYGPDPVTIPLTALNVLIGPNGSGKTNLVEAISVLRALPNDLTLPIRKGGGVREWLWKGDAKTEQAVVEVVFAAGKVVGAAVRYRLVFGVEGDSFVVLDERIQGEADRGGTKRARTIFQSRSELANIILQGQKVRARFLRATHDPTQSILSRQRGPEYHPEWTRIGDLLRNVRLYRSWHFGPGSVLRESCNLDERTDRLSEDLDNLPARLAAVKSSPPLKRRLLDLLQELAPGFEDLEVTPEGGRLRLDVTVGGQSFPARRLSDGTLRFLSLLAILLDPVPDSLVVIEEPELGLHPDILPVLRDLLVEASAHCQLLVTTHSTQLADAMTDHSDSMLICEKKGQTTQVSRLTQEEVDRWRAHGSLGSLWMAGHFGGTRW